AVLDGGFDAWTREERPTTSGLETRDAGTFEGTPRADMTVGAADVASHLADPSWRLVDARAPERYRGEVEPLDKVAGHIPGAANHFFQANIGADGLFRSPEDLRERLQRAIGEVPADHVVAYCGSGVTACHNLLALEHAGLTGAR